MKHFISSVSILFVITFFAQAVFAQDSISIYNKNNLFDPTFLQQDGTEFRSANGAPGPKYWQNSVNYSIHTTLDEKDTTLKLPVDVWRRDSDWTFKYNSTTPLTSVVLDPNGELPDINRKNNTWEGK